MNLQKRYWNKMVQARFNCLYINGYYNESVKFDRNINIFLAVVSCGSIAGWAIWNECAFLWAIIVAISQVVNAIKPFLPYSARIKDLFSCEIELRQLQNNLEHGWYKVAAGELTEIEINDLILEYDKASLSISQKYLTDDSLKKNEKLKKQADNQTDIYFKKYFGED